MRHKEIKTYLRQLQQVLPRVPAIPVGALKSLHKARDYEGMIRLIRKTMNIEVDLRIGWVNRGEPKNAGAPAWVKLPDEMPFYGSKAFREMRIEICFRKSFLEQSAYDQIAIVVAHELSHIVLDSIGHPLRREEMAVDLTAMLLGFRQLYKSGCYKEQRFRNSTTSQTVGYLTPQEVQLADQILARGQPGAILNGIRTASLFLSGWSRCHHGVVGGKKHRRCADCIHQEWIAEQKRPG